MQWHKRLRRNLIYLLCFIFKVIYNLKLDLNHTFYWTVDFMSEYSSTEHLRPVINVDPEKCCNCHRCISVCPVKMCNNGSGNHVSINHDLCIGCGTCIDACVHGARTGIDDMEEFFHDLQNGVPVVAIVAPAVAVSFPEQDLNLNGWLKSIGVKAVFDVAFGAELTTKSYVEQIKKEGSVPLSD